MEMVLKKNRRRIENNIEEQLSTKISPLLHPPKLEIFSLRRFSQAAGFKRRFEEAMTFYQSLSTLRETFSEYNNYRASWRGVRACIDARLDYFNARSRPFLPPVITTTRPLLCVSTRYYVRSVHKSPTG